MTTLTPSPPKVKQLEPKAPSGRDVAAGMIARAAKAPKQVKAKIPGAKKQPKARVPKATPYNPLNSPYKSQPQFNTAVTQQAKTEYEPKLNQLGTEEQGEQGLHEQRGADNVNIYKQYSEQATKAYETAQQAMAQIASRQNSSTSAGQAALQAALSNTGVSGLSGVANQDQFMNEAAGLGNEGSQTLAGMQSGITGEMSKDLSVPGAGLAEATQQEGVRDSAERAKIATERSKVVGEEPNDLAKARNELSKEEQERAANKLQGQIAQGKLGLEGRATNVEEQKTNVADETARAEVGIKEQAVQNEKLKFQQEAKEAKTKKEEAAALLRGKRYDNGLKIMTEYLKENAKTEFRPGAPNAAQLTTEGKQEYRRNAEHLYKILTEQGNLTAPEAFKLMKSSGNGYIEKYAGEHERIYNAKLHPSTKVVTNGKGGKIEVPTYRPPGESNKNNAKREKELKTGKTQ